MEYVLANLEGSNFKPNQGGGTLLRHYTEVKLLLSEPIKKVLFFIFHTHTCTLGVHDIMLFLKSSIVFLIVSNKYHL